MRLRITKRDGYGTADGAHWARNAVAEFDDALAIKLLANGIAVVERAVRKPSEKTARKKAS